MLMVQPKQRLPLPPKILCWDFDISMQTDNKIDQMFCECMHGCGHLYSSQALKAATATLCRNYKYIEHTSQFCITTAPAAAPSSSVTAVTQKKMEHSHFNSMLLFRWFGKMAKYICELILLSAI